jgi:hypothetical protein
MQRWMTGAAAALALLAFGIGSATAAPGADTQFLGNASLLVADPLQEELALDALATSSDPGTQHIGPIASGSPDSGTCGNDWAQDTFDRFFTIKQNKDGTFRVVEQFKNGTFVTNSTVFSPGACDATDGYGPGTIVPNDVGTMHGYLLLTVTCSNPLEACPNPAPDCNAFDVPTGMDACQTTGGFLREFFGQTAAATASTDAFFFHYAGYDGTNQTLAVNEWKNASCNRGGNHGDIATTSTGPIPPAPCA